MARAFQAWNQILLNGPICRAWWNLDGWLAHSWIADLFIDGLARAIAILTICPFSASGMNKYRAGDSASSCYNNAQISTFYRERVLEYNILFIILPVADTQPMLGCHLESEWYFITQKREGKKQLSSVIKIICCTFL